MTGKEKKDFNVLTWWESQKLFCMYVEVDYMEYIMEDEVRIDSFLPLTTESFAVVSMLYPSVIYQEIQACLKDWETFPFDPDSNVDYYCWSMRSRGWYE